MKNKRNPNLNKHGIPILDKPSEANRLPVQHRPIPPDPDDVSFDDEDDIVSLGEIESRNQKFLDEPV
jgi:hypothetical protein